MYASGGVACSAGSSTAPPIGAIDAIGTAVTGCAGASDVLGLALAITRTGSGSDSSRTSADNVRYTAIATAS
jgi:hypothetical protein